MARRWAAPAALSIVAVAGGIVGLRPAPAARAVGTEPAPRAAVLSARRVPALLSAAVADARLRVALDRVLLDPELGAGRADNCLLVTGSTGTLYERTPDRSLAPASTLKLLTATAVLIKLGGDAHLTTSVVAGTAPSAGVVAGDVYLVGGGDPLLGTGDYAASFKDPNHRFTDLNALADSVATAGVKVIHGSVRGDESRYDTQRYVPTWKTAYAVDGDVGPLSALAFNDGFVAWKPKAVPTPVPAGHAAAVFTDMLRARGITVDGEPGEGRAPTQHSTLATLDSLKMRDLVGEMLVHSDNESAELLTKELGRRFGGAGTTAAGLEVIKKTLVGAGVDLHAVSTTDASGLAPGDRVDCRVLHAVLSGPTRRLLLDAGLAVAGETGTMFDHFKNGNAAAGRLRGKTGTLEGVVGLAGVIDGNDVTFAFLAGSLPAPSEARGKRVLERLGAALAAYPNAPAAAALKP